MYKSVTDKMPNNSDLDKLSPENKERYMVLFNKMRNNPGYFTKNEQDEFNILFDQTKGVGGRSKQSRKRFTRHRRSSKRKVRKTRNTRRRY